MRLLSCLIVVVGAIVILAGGRDRPAPSAAAAAPPVTGSALPASSQPKCPYREGEDCLGKLDPGTYTTQLFTPKLTYTVPAGWTNLADAGGNFVLAPDRSTPAGVNRGMADYVGVYTSVEAEQNVCRASVPTPGVPHTPAGLARWIHRHPGVRSTTPKPATIGGLSGFVLDITLAKGGGITCPSLPGRKGVGLITGLLPSNFDHRVTTGRRMRLYLLAYNHGALGIEIEDDRGGGDHLAEYDALVHHLRFG
jgi:hypothetical protein